MKKMLPVCYIKMKTTTQNSFYTIRKVHLQQTDSYL